MSLAAAGFARRYAAWSLDMGLMAAIAVALCAPRLRTGAAALGERWDALSASLAGLTVEVALYGRSPWTAAQHWLADPRQQALLGALHVAVSDTLATPLALLLGLALAWWVGWEASPWQATPGKRLLGLRVAGSTGSTIGPGRALARHLAGTASWLTLNFGHLLALAPPAHAALHDRLAGTRVLQAAGPRALPRWAWAWLAGQVLAMTLAGVWLAAAAQDSLLRAFEALP